MIEIGTVCTGIGSPEQALKELGIPHKIKFACEKDKYARKSYLENFNPELMLEDMTKESWIGNEFKSDLYVGGIPCQSFSLAGKRLGELDPRGLLFYDFYRYVKEQQPKYFIIENVKGLISDNDGKTFRNWKDLLGCSENGTPYFFPHEDSLLYNLHWEVLNTKDYELPQNRERVFLVGIRNDLPNDFVFPAKKPLKIRLKNILEQNVHIKYYLSENMVKGIVFKSNENNIGYINQNTQASQVFSDESIFHTLSAGTHGYANGYLKIKSATKKRYEETFDNNIINIEYPESQTRRGRVNKNLAFTLKTNPNNAVIQLNNSKESGGKQPYQQNRIYDSNGISPALMREKSDIIIQINNPTHSNDRIYDAEGISPTLNTMQGGNRQPFIYNDFSIRKLTPLECFRLQGYSDSFFHNCQKVNSDTQLYKQAGNTISVTVMKAILKNLLKYEPTQEN